MEEPDRPAKRAKLSPNIDHADNDSTQRTNSSSNDSNNHPLASLHRSITPPILSRSKGPKPPPQPQPQPQHNATHPASPSTQTTKKENDAELIKDNIIPSPIQLTHIRDLPASSGHNTDTVRLRDILGDPLIRECWQFNYLFDVDFLMSQFDEDVRRLVKVKVVHGSWKRDAPNRQRIDEACTRHPNVEAITAYMPEAFGTHHSKMMILLRHDDLAQVVIHTANMIAGDWANMCQAVWRSPLLPLCSNSSGSESIATPGTRFKRDLLSYLREYGPKKTGPLVAQLEKHDFSTVRAALVASVPSKQKIRESTDSTRKTLWGWLALRDVLRSVPIDRSEDRPHIVTQISSVASLGQTDKWLKDVFFTSLSPSSNTPKPRFSIIFPTPDEIRRSLNGYGSGGSIHMKLQSAAQQKQLQYMRSYLCHWAGDGAEDEVKVKREAGRRRAAPHIKTYIRYSSSEMDRIDWAMVTSANLSTQAWGAAVNANGEVRICSWEIGVVVWPELVTGAGAEGRSVMVPCFRRDVPDADAVAAAGAAANANVKEIPTTTTVGFRMPYDLPLTRYSETDIPWCATASHSEPDWLGQTWEA